MTYEETLKEGTEDSRECERDEEMRNASVVGRLEYLQSSIPPVLPDL